MRKLTPAQERAVRALLEQPTMERAAAAAGVSEAQLDAWLGQTSFWNAYRRGREDLVDRASRMAQSYSPAAVQTMARIMVDEKAAAANRIAAAQAILRIAREGIDVERGIRDEAVRLSLAGP